MGCDSTHASARFIQLRYSTYFSVDHLIQRNSLHSSSSEELQAVFSKTHPRDVQAKLGYFLVSKNFFLTYYVSALIGKFFIARVSDNLHSY